MTMQRCTRIFSSQLVDELTQRVTLCRRARVLRITYRVNSADVAYTNRCGVMPGGVRTYATNVSPLVDATVEIDDVVIAYAVKTSLTMPLVDVSDCVVTPLGRRCAVHNDLLNISHNVNY